MPKNIFLFNVAPVKSEVIFDSFGSTFVGALIFHLTNAIPGKGTAARFKIDFFLVDIKYSAHQPLLINSFHKKSFFLILTQLFRSRIPQNLLKCFKW